MALSNDAQIAMEQGMMIAEVNIAIGAIDRILKTAKHGRSNNRELTNARAELDHWPTRLVRTRCKSQKLNARENDDTDEDLPAPRGLYKPKTKHIPHSV